LEVRLLAFLRISEPMTKLNVNAISWFDLVFLKLQFWLGPTAIHAVQEKKKKTNQEER
jgi:hypothetical protein